MSVTVRFADAAIRTLARRAAGTVAGLVRVVDCDIAPGGGAVALRVVVRPSPPPVTVAAGVVTAVRTQLLSAGAETDGEMPREVGVTIVGVEP
ncbi:hypothetical protein [Jatrophihabitans fulvus]